jgi:hypothetical protein
MLNKGVSQINENSSFKSSITLNNRQGPVSRGDHMLDKSALYMVVALARRRNRQGSDLKNRVHGAPVSGSPFDDSWHPAWLAI